MGDIRKAVPIVLAFALLSGVGHLRAEEHRSGVAGRVLGDKAPLVAAGVYAYQLADLTLHKVVTDGQGNFLFQNLPVGLYKIVAHKPGFVPIVVMLTRTRAQAYQFLEVELAQRQVGQAPEQDDYWAIRARIPSDVLHEIDRDEIQLPSFFPSRSGALAGNFHTEMQAISGVDDIAGGDGQVSGAGLGIEGTLGSTKVELRGQFRQLDAAPVGVSGGAGGGGQASSLSLDVAGGGGSRISVMSRNDRMALRDSDSPVDFQHYQVNYSQDVGENGRSDFVALYTAENNFHRQGLGDPLDIPETSQSWRIEGAYTTALGDRGSLQAGLRYRERQFGLSDVERPGKAYEKPTLSSVDLFSRGGVSLQPSFVIQYGLYSTLSDGSLSLMPQGGFVLQLDPKWQVEASASQRVYQDAAAPDFLPSLFQQNDLCEQGSESCYEVRFSRAAGEDNSFSVGAVHRVVGDTLRLYFSEDFFDRLQSLYLVRGDEIPEVKMSLNRRLSPRVTTTWETSVAAGGGGMFVAPTGQPFENQVRYLITSLDTQFQRTSTGVFVSFHHLSQQLDPAAGTSGPSVARIESERLRFMLSQDLSFLLDLAADWAVQLNMELSRGATPTEAQDHLRHRFLGGIAVKF
ncbi:MAG TPA: carboxypeptidase-like regulatory domain-containing protein [Thermoanaerobaculia bacterium]|nr:carboxypeptidase-like regulatory domain-containing protein [Thermoanaerobaculia bacterium]